MPEQRPEIYDPINVPSTRLAVSVTNWALEENPTLLTGTFRGRRYSISEQLSLQANTVVIIEETTGNVVTAKAQLNSLTTTQIDITVHLHDGREQTETYGREATTSTSGRIPIKQTPSSEPLPDDLKEVAIYCLYVAQRTLSDAGPARRARQSSLEPNPGAVGRYENTEYRTLGEYPEYLRRENN